MNTISAARRRYLAAGALGILVGDSKPPGAGAIGEGWYDVSIAERRSMPPPPRS